MSAPRRLTFDVTPHRLGGYTAQCREVNLVAEGATREAVVANAEKAAEAYYVDQGERGLPGIDFVFPPSEEPQSPR